MSGRQLKDDKKITLLPVPTYSRFTYVEKVTYARCLMTKPPLLTSTTFVYDSRDVYPRGWVGPGSIVAAAMPREFLTCVIEGGGASLSRGQRGGFSARVPERRHLGTFLKAHFFWLRIREKKQRKIPNVLFKELKFLFRHLFFRISSQFIVVCLFPFTLRYHTIL